MSLVACPNIQGRVDYLPPVQKAVGCCLSCCLHGPLRSTTRVRAYLFVVYCDVPMTDRPFTSIMSDVSSLMSLWTAIIRNQAREVDHDQDPKTETLEVPPTQVDSEGLSYEIIDNSLQAPEPTHPEATAAPQEIVCKLLHRAHVELQMMSEEYGRLKEHYKDVSHDRDALQGRVQTMESTISQYADHCHRIKSTANALQDQLAATRAELVQVRQDLQTSRSFVSTEASDDGKTLADMLSVLNQKIDEFAYVVGDLVPSQMGGACFAPPKTEKGLADMKSLETLGVFAIQTNLSLADVLQYGIQHATCEYLLDIFFMPFAPGMRRSLSRHLSELHCALVLHYPQAYSGRWRAMTYSHVRPQSMDLPREARWWVEHILSLVNLCAPGCHPAKDPLPTKALEKAKEMLSAAIALQDKAKTAYLAYNYEVLAVDLGSRFNEREMSYGGDDKKKEKHGEVVAVLGLGLKAWRSVCEDEGKYVREQVIPVRVSVLTAV